MRTEPRLQELREARGLTQAELAERAGVSRQMIGAVESGRNLPRVDGALALARALGVTVTDLFPEREPVVDVITGRAPAEGAMVRVGRVADITVTADSRVGIDGYDVADAVFADGELDRLGSRAGGPVMVGCEPGLEVLERILRERGHGGVAVMTSSRTAMGVLGEGRAHLAVVHHEVDRPVSHLDDHTTAIHLTRWQVGLASSPESGRGWVEAALAGEVPVVQREPGATVQTTFLGALEPGAGSPVGPIAATHLEAARRAMWSGVVALTIEPAARAVGARFHPLATHEAMILFDSAMVSDQNVRVALDIVSDLRFQRRLSAIGGYDLSSIGVRAA